MENKSKTQEYVEYQTRGESSLLTSYLNNFFGWLYRFLIVASHCLRLIKKKVKPAGNLLINEGVVSIIICK